jgi:hypothetical protein
MAVVHTVHAQLIFYTPSVDFGKIEIGNSSPTITLDLRNTGSQSLVINCSGGAASSSQFFISQACQGITLNPGETCPYSFIFTPDAAGILTGSSNLSCNSVPLSVNLSGEGVLPKLVFDTPSVDFGPVPVGTASPLVVVNLFNKGTAPVTVSCAGGSPSLPQFDAGQVCQGSTLNPGDSCPFTYNFTPDAAGSFTGSSNVFCNGVSLSTQLLGEGLLPALVVDTPAVDFGTVKLNTTSPTVSVDLRNQGQNPVTISCAGGASSQPQFGGWQACQGSTLNSGDTCTWSFNFTPDGPGEVTGASNFSCNGVVLGVTLRGVGGADLIFADSFE